MADSQFEPSFNKPQSARPRRISIEQIGEHCTQTIPTPDAETLLARIEELKSEDSQALGAEVARKNFLRQQINRLQGLIVTEDGSPVAADQLCPRLTDLSFFNQAKDARHRRPWFAVFTPHSHTCTMRSRPTGPVGWVKNNDSSPDLLGQFFKSGPYPLIWIFASPVLVGTILGALLGTYPITTVITVGCAVFGALAGLLISTGWCIIFVGVMESLDGDVKHSSVGDAAKYGAIQGAMVGFIAAIIGSSMGSTTLTHSYRENSILYQTAALWSIGICVLLSVGRHIQHEVTKGNNYEWDLWLSLGAARAILGGLTGGTVGWFAASGGQSLLLTYGSTTIASWSKFIPGHGMFFPAGAILTALTGTAVATLLSGLWALFARNGERKTVTLETGLLCVIPAPVQELIRELQKQFDEVFIVTEAGEWCHNYSPVGKVLMDAPFLIIVRKGENYWLPVSYTPHK